MTRAGWFFFLAGLAGASLLVVIAWKGADYFTLPGALRPMHPRHDDLRSGGRTGLACGIVGSALITINLSYLLRKRLLSWKWLGSLRAWMAFHIFTGILGALLIAVHSGLLLRSTLGILAFSGLGIAVFTGLIGRYIYAHVPRSLEGHELERAELARRLDANRMRLEQEGIDVALLDPPVPAAMAKGLTARLRGVLAGRRETRQRYRALRRAIAKRRDLKHLLPTARRFTRELQWQARYEELRGLMGSWRFLHRWLAVVMLIVTVFHVYVAVRFGHLEWPWR